MKRIIVSVINDLVTDQRVHRTCTTLHEMGFDVLLIGRKKRDSLPLLMREYQTHRINLVFEKGFLFYAEYNIRLYFYLLFHSADVLFSNDLDTLLPNFIIHKIKRIPIIFDSHEYFTETPELINRPTVKKVWKNIERFILPRMSEMITINASIAQMFENEYGINVSVVRNIPMKIKETKKFTKKELGLPENGKLILIQGSGLNVDRGLEELVDAMNYIDNAILIIVGNGDVIPIIKQNVANTFLEDKVNFIPKQSFERLHQYTLHADLGLSFDKDTNLNYRYSLPNKIFDYIHAGVPILCSPLVEVKNIVEKYEVGECIDNHDPKHIAECINSMLENEAELKRYKANTKVASSELNWENEKLNLIKILDKYV